MITTLRIFGVLSILLGLYVIQFNPLAPVILVIGGIVLVSIPKESA